MKYDVHLRNPSCGSHGWLRLFVFQASEPFHRICSCGDYPHIADELFRATAEIRVAVRSTRLEQIGHQMYIRLISQRIRCDLTNVLIGLLKTKPK